MTVPGQVQFERIAYEPVSWEAVLSAHPDAQVFHSAAWLAYLADTQGAEPVIARVHVGGSPVGHFVGATVRRYGVRILGSPLRGWGTAYMGFLLDPGVNRAAVAAALPGFAFRHLGCQHVELGDRDLTRPAMVQSGFAADDGATYLVDLAASEEAILARMRSTTRNYIRRGPRTGLTATVVSGVDFADEFHEQLTEVFARQSLGPTYPVQRVRRLIEIVGPSGQLLLLRVAAPDGRSIATAIAVGRNRTAVLWGAASHRTDAELLHPNELLHWEAMRYWRGRGVATYDMGGRGDYKAKYGGVLTQTARFHRSRFPILEHGRSAVRAVVRARQRVAGVAAQRALGR